MSLRIKLKQFVYIYSIITLTYLIFLIFCSNIFASTTYYKDDFNDGNTDGWEETFLTYCGNSKWIIDQYGRYGIKIDSIWGCKTQSILINQTIPEESSYVYEFDMNFAQNANMDRNFYIKYQSIDRWYGFHIVNQNIFLEKVYVGMDYTNPFSQITYPFNSNQTYHFKITVNNNVIFLEIKNSQNQIYSHTYIDEDPILSNKYVGLRASTGEITSSEVWFDNIELTINPFTQNTLFNLPINYTNRSNSTQLQFQSKFWSKLTAAFDHNKQGNKYTPFTTSEYEKKSCPTGKVGIECYDAHNGTDFAPNTTGDNDYVYPVANGQIVYTSTIEDKKCVPDKSGFGCVVIIYHPDSDLYTLYAHLSEISTNTDAEVGYTESIGKMGNTGCGPKCGVHLHLGVLKNKTPTNLNKEITSSDWENILKQAEPAAKTTTVNPPKHWCTYKSPTGIVLSFQDPSGWSDQSKFDPWNLSIDAGGCNTESPYMWMYNVGTSKPSQLVKEVWYNEEFN